MRYDISSDGLLIVSSKHCHPIDLSYHLIRDNNGNTELENEEQTTQSQRNGIIDYLGHFVPGPG